MVGHGLHQWAQAIGVPVPTGSPIESCHPRGGWLGTGSGLPRIGPEAHVVGPRDAFDRVVDRLVSHQPPPLRGGKNRRSAGGSHGPGSGLDTLPDG